MDSSPLRRDQIGPLLRAPDKELRSAALWVVSHHPDWAEVVLEYLGERLKGDRATGVELDAVRDALLAFSGSPATQNFIGDLLADRSVADKQLVFLLNTISEIRLKELPPSWAGPLAGLLSNPNQSVRLGTVDLIRSRALSGFDAELERIAADVKEQDQLRAAALDVLIARRPQLTPDQYLFLTSRLSSQSDAVLRQTAARILGRSKPDKAQLLRIAKDHLSNADPLTLSTVLDSFRNSTDEEVGQALVSVLGKAPSVLGTLGEERLKSLLSGYSSGVKESSKHLFEQLKQAQSARIERLRKLEPLLTAAGDVGRGRRLFFGEKIACSSCHTMGAQGGHVGPDLTGIGAIRSGHDLLEAIVFPNASFVPGHEVFNVDTQTERISGVIRSQSREAVVLVTGPNGEIRIPRANIKSLKPSQVSLMPEGFDQQLTESELTDLLAYLQAEKTGPQTVEKPGFHAN